jgi:hypothetical protein
MNGTTWTQVTVPYPGLPGEITPDGNGGLWTAAIQPLANGTDQFWMLHMSAAGTWSSYQIQGSWLTDVTQVPGTASVWSVGSVPAKSGWNAAIWAYGPLP